MQVYLHPHLGSNKNDKLMFFMLFLKIQTFQHFNFIHLHFIFIIYAPLLTLMNSIYWRRMKVVLQKIGDDDGTIQ